MVEGRVILSVLDGDMLKRVLSERCVSAPHGPHLAVAARHGCILATPDEDMATVARDLGLTVMVP